MIRGPIILLTIGILMLLVGLGYLLFPAFARRALPGKSEPAGLRGIYVAGIAIAVMGATLAIFASVTWLTIS